VIKLCTFCRNIYPRLILWDNKQFVYSILVFSEGSVEVILYVSSLDMKLDAKLNMCCFLAFDIISFASFVVFLKTSAIFSEGATIYAHSFWCHMCSTETHCNTHVERLWTTFIIIIIIIIIIYLIRKSSNELSLNNKKHKIRDPMPGQIIYSRINMHALRLTSRTKKRKRILHVLYNV